MQNKTWKVVIIIFLVGGIIVGYVWLTVDLWNPADVLMKFAMTISSPNAETESFKNFFSGRIKRNLNDGDFDLLHNNFSKPEAWQEFFGKIPKKKFRLLPIKETGGLGLKGVIINLQFTPSITGWKIDGLQSVRPN